MEDLEMEVHLAVMDAHQSILSTVMRDSGVRRAIALARRAAVPLPQIIATLLQIIVSVMAGGALNWPQLIQTIIAAIMALIPVPKAA